MPPRGSEAGTLPDWDAVFAALESWKREQPCPQSTDPVSGNGESPARGQKTAAEPSVTALADQYRRDPWAVLVSTILSLRTKDEVTLKTSRALLREAPAPEKLLSLPEETVAELAYPAGFYRTKAATLRKIASILVEQYGSSVPADLDALLALPGVGRKTANLVLNEAFDMDGICVDTHVHRICNRAGWVRTASPDKTEAVLREILPLEYWKPINPLLVLYGQRICRPISPYCSRCRITRFCARIGVDRSR